MRSRAVPRSRKWREDSLGDRFFSVRHITGAAGAAVIAEAKLPTPQEVAENSGHWTVAVSALVRAVLLDGVPVSDPAVAGWPSCSPPVVWDELAAADDVDKDFPDTQGPLFLLGACFLTDATWAIVGLDPLDQALDLMERLFDDALARAGGAAWPTGRIIAEELIRAFAGEYRCEKPGDVRMLKHLGRSASGNPLTDLIRVREVAPEDALRLGLIILAAMADLARTDAESALPSSAVSES